MVFICGITLYCENEYPFTFERRKFTVKIAFAMAINKAQDQTMNKISLDSRKQVFNQGQLYVASSGDRSWDSLKTYLSDELVDLIKNFFFSELRLNYSIISKTSDQSIDEKLLVCLFTA